MQKKTVILFEKVLYLREMEPFMELSWTKWITEEVRAYNSMFAMDGAENDIQQSPEMAKYITTRWGQMVRSN